MQKRKRHGHRFGTGLEKLESRYLLSADCQLTSSIFTTAGVEDYSILADDAGSTRATAMDLGTLTDTRIVEGSVSRFDRSDVFRFATTQSDNAVIDLTGLSRNANLALYDASGRQLASSAQSRNSDERIEYRVSAGEYFVAVIAATRRTTSYRLSITGFEPPTDPPPAPAAPTAPITSPPATSPPVDGVGPLADVAYFGSNRDWNLNQVGAPESWAHGFTGQGVTVAIVDTGIDLDHADLNDNLWINTDEIPGNGIDDDGNGFIDDRHGWDFAGRDSVPNDTNGHGTHVAGTVAAEFNGLGATGVAHGATIMPVRVLGGGGRGSSADVAAGIRYAAENGADIINLSLGGGFSRVIASAIEYAGRLGSLVVAAAGNDSASVPGYPARYSATQSHVISVGAHNSSGVVAGFSNRTGNSGAVQVDAPGVSVYSTYAGGGNAWLSGTSMAAPHVAGLAALALSASPNLTAPQLRNLLVDGISGSISGSDAIGRVHAATTVAFAAAGLTGSGSPSASISSLAGAGARIIRFVFTTSVPQHTSTALSISEISEELDQDRTDLSWSISSTTTQRLASYNAHTKITASWSAASADHESEGEPSEHELETESIDTVSLTPFAVT